MQSKNPAALGSWIKYSLEQTEEPRQAERNLRHEGQNQQQDDHRTVERQEALDRGLGIWDQSEISIWLEIVYHVANGFLLLLVIGSYLKDEWFMVTTDVRFYFNHVMITVGLIAAAEFALLGALYLGGFNIIDALECLPITEMPVSHTPLATIGVQPIIGTLVLSVFSPISICGLFYCLGFAPICYKKPWLAYLCIAVITLIPPIVDILWRDDDIWAVFHYLMSLPVHLLACWSYQKTDNPWTPLLSVATANLLISVFLILFYI